MELVVVQGDVLEFAFTVTDESGQEYVLQDGEKFFFMVAPHCNSGNCEIHIVQTSKYFKVENVELKPNVYDFDAGIIFADGTKKTLIDGDTGKLRVKRRVGPR